MTKKSIVCPNCNAEIEASPKQVFVYCRYCGVKIQTEDIVEIRHIKDTDSLEKMISDGEIYCKLEDYYRAELKFREVIKKYPQERKGYEGLIQALTHNQTLYPPAHEEEVYRLLEQLESLIQEKEKTDFADRCHQIKESFAEEKVRVENEIPDRHWKKETERKTNILIIKGCACFMVFMTALMFVTLDFDIGWPVALPGFCVSAVLLYSIWKDK